MRSAVEPNEKPVVEAGGEGAILGLVEALVVDRGIRGLLVEMEKLATESESSLEEDEYGGRSSTGRERGDVAADGQW